MRQKELDDLKELLTESYPLAFGCRGWDRRLSEYERMLLTNQSLRRMAELESSSTKEK